MSAEISSYDGFMITIDLDWAPDYAIDWLAVLLAERRVRVTWFVTHASPAVDRLRDHPDLFELGVHPNFLPGSTHGETTEDVLEHVMAIVPDAISFRSHSVVQSGRIVEAVIRRTSLKIESNYLMPGGEGLRPARYRQFGGELLRVPFFWSDDYELGQESPDWDASRFASVRGLKVLDFHPVHLFFNSSSDEDYARLKAVAGELSRLEPRDASDLVCEGKGVRDFLEKIVEITSEERSVRMSDLLRPERSES